MPMGDTLKWLLREGGWYIFKSCDKYAHLTHSLTYAITVNGDCLHLLVSPLAQHCMLLQCFLLNITVCTMA